MGQTCGSPANIAHPRSVVINTAQKEDALYMLHYYQTHQASTGTSKLLTKNMNNNSSLDDNVLLLGAQNSGKTTIFRQLHRFVGLSPELISNDQDLEDLAKKIQLTLIFVLRRLTCDCDRRPGSPQSPSTYNAKLGLEQCLGECPCSQTDMSIDCSVDLTPEALLCATRLARGLECGESFFKRDFIRSISDEHRNLDEVVPAGFLHVAQYLMGRAEVILKSCYLPSSKDLVYFTESTRGLQEFQMNVSGFPFSLIDAGGSKSERRRWIHCFEGVACVFFCVDLCTWANLEESLSIFDELCNSIWIRSAKFVVLLTKKDLFRKRFAEAEFKQVYPQFQGTNSLEAISFIARRFEARNRMRRSGSVSYMSLCSFDPQEVQDLLRCLREMLPTALLEAA